MEQAHFVSGWTDIDGCSPGKGEIAVAVERRSGSALAAGETAAEKILRSGKSLQRRIVLFSIIIVVATSILVAALISAQRKSALERAWFDSANLSAVFEEHVRQVVNTVSGAMDRFKADIEQYGAETALKGWMRRSESASIPAQFTVTGVDGRVVASAFDPNNKSQDLSDREHFRVHVGTRQRGLFIGKPIRGRLSGQPAVPLSSRLERADGKFDGVVIASLDPDFITSLYRSVDLGETGSLMLLGTDGIVRAYFRGGPGHKGGEDTSVLGSSRLDIRALRDSQFDSEGSYETVSQTDGIMRLFHWRKVRGYPLIVIVGMGKSEALLPANRQGAMVLGVGGTALILALFMPFMLHREISKRIANEIGLNNEKVKLKHVNDALAEERKNLRAMNHELTAQKHRAEEASNAKSNFLMNMSHEFRTPMHAILNYTNMSLKRIAVEDRDKIQKYMQNTRAAGLRLLGMLNILLDLAKLEAGKIEFQVCKADLLLSVKATQDELGSLLEEKSIRVDIHVKTEDTFAMLDPTRITQILVNLFSNAIKFSPLGGVIQVKLESASLDGGLPGLQCSILDDGRGIPQGELVKIFDQFSQSSTTVKNGGGSGLGLTICRELIDLHGGVIWAANRHEGGACLSFILPRKPFPLMDSEPPSSSTSEALLPLPVRVGEHSM